VNPVNAAFFIEELMVRRVFANLLVLAALAVVGIEGISYFDD
jgi:hypothetical protein